MSDDMNESPIANLLRAQAAASPAVGTREAMVPAGRRERALPLSPFVKAMADRWWDYDDGHDNWAVLTGAIAETVAALAAPVPQQPELCQNCSENGCRGQHFDGDGTCFLCPCTGRELPDAPVPQQPAQVQHFLCPGCGPAVVDEDGCCVSCGADTTIEADRAAQQPFADPDHCAHTCGNCGAETYGAAWVRARDADNDAIKAESVAAAESRTVAEVARWLEGEADRHLNDGASASTQLSVMAARLRVKGIAALDAATKETP